MPTEDSENDPPIHSGKSVVVVQGVGHLSREFMREVGSLFWFMVQTTGRNSRADSRWACSIRASSFFRHCQRAGVARFRWSVWFHFFSPDHGFANGYQLQRFGTSVSCPDWLQSLLTLS